MSQAILNNQRFSKDSALDKIRFSKETNKVASKQTKRESESNKILTEVFTEDSHHYMKMPSTLVKEFSADKYSQDGQNTSQL